MAVTIGTPVQINATGTDPLAIVQLTSTQSMIIYEDSTRLKARILTNGDPPTANAELDIDPTSVFGDDATLTAITSTSAMVIYDHNNTDIRARILTVSGTTITANAQTTLTDNKISTSSLSSCLIDTTRVLYCYNFSGCKAVILSISGTTITENAIINVGNINTKAPVRCAAFSTTRAIAVYARASTFISQGTIISIAGNVLTSNVEKDIDNSGPLVQTGDNDAYAIQMSATKVVAGFIDGRVASRQTLNYVLTLSGVTFNVGTTATDAVSISNNLDAAKLSDTSLITVTESATNTMRAVKYNITGGGSDVLTADGSDTLSGITNLDTIKCGPVDTNYIMVHYIGSSNSAVEILGGSPGTYTLAAMRKPADLAEDGGTIYISALNASGTPVLIQFSTLLNADGSIVFDPGAGDNIGVECGRFNADVIWVVGNFDGTNVIEKSEDGGTTFTVKDDATIGNVRTFVMGPDSDDRLLVFDETNGDILETINSGDSWNSINAAVTPEVNAIARLGENVQETVFGNDGAANNSVNYSVNSGDDLEDYQTGVYPNANATGVIAN